MSYALAFNISLGSSKSGLTLAAQLVDTAGGDVGAEIASGFTEIGGGAYLLHYTAVPDVHRGGIKFYESGVPETILAFAAINPEEGEYTNQKITTTETNIRGADNDTLKTLSEQVDAAATSTQATNLQNSIDSILVNTRATAFIPKLIERPDSGSETLVVHLYLYDQEGNMEAPDSAPTVALANPAGTDRSSRLDSTTMTLVGTGHYKVVYTSANTDAIEQLLWTFTVVEGGKTRTYGGESLIVDTTAVDFTATDRSKLDGIYNKLPSRSYLASSAAATGETQTDAAAALTAYDPPTKAELDTAESNIRGEDSDTLKTLSVQIDDVPNNSEFQARTLVAASYATSAAMTTLTNIFAGITSLAKWLRGLYRSDSMDSTAKSEVNSGGGGYDETKHSQQAQYGTLTVIVTGLEVVPGGTETTITVKVDGIPIEGAEVWITNDEAGADVAYGVVYTNALGKASFMLEDASGPFYAWIQKSGYNITNPTQLVWNAETEEYEEA